MFLDDELIQIYNEEKHNMDNCMNLLVQAMVKRLPRPETVKPGDNPINMFKRIDASWRMFCSKVDDSKFKPDGFRNLVKQSDLEGKVVKALGW